MIDISRMILGGIGKSSMAQRSIQTLNPTLNITDDLLITPTMKVSLWGKGNILTKYLRLIASDTSREIKRSALSITPILKKWRIFKNDFSPSSVKYFDRRQMQHSKANISDGVMRLQRFVKKGAFNRKDVMHERGPSSSREKSPAQPFVHVRANSRRSRLNWHRRDIRSALSLYFSFKKFSYKLKIPAALHMMVFCLQTDTGRECIGRTYLSTKRCKYSEFLNKIQRWNISA